MTAPESPLLSAAGLEVRFGDDAPAVRGVDLEVRSGQTVAIVGESGSGKSTTAAAILGLLPPGGRITAGRIVFDGVDLTAAGRRQLRSIRGTGIGYVPQDPMTNLNPVWKVGFQVQEALRANNIDRQAAQLLADAGMLDPGLRARQYPHQLSGGMCQRALIAIGLAGSTGKTSRIYFRNQSRRACSVLATPRTDRPKVMLSATVRCGNSA